MHLKLIVALAFVAVCSGRYLGSDNYYFVNIADENIVITGHEGRQVDIVLKYYPEQYGQQYIKVFVNGPDFPAKTLQYVDYPVNAGVYQSDILYQVFHKFAGRIHEQQFVELLTVLEKYVETGEIHPIVYYALQYMYYQNQDYLKDEYFTEGGILGQNYYSRDMSYGMYGQNYYPSWFGKYLKGYYPSWYNQYYQAYYPGFYNKYFGGYYPSWYNKYYQGSYPSWYNKYYQGAYPSWYSKYYQGSYPSWYSKYYQGAYPSWYNKYYQGAYPSLYSKYFQGYYPSFYNKYYQGYNQVFDQDYYQTPYNKLGFYFGLGGYRGNDVSNYYGGYGQYYPYYYGGSYYRNMYYGPYSDNFYQYGYGYNQYPQLW